MRISTASGLLGAALLASCGGNDGAAASKEQFHAAMTAAQEVPAPDVTGANPQGTASFTNNGDGTVAYSVNATGLTTQDGTTTLTGMHIHLAQSGTAAPVAVPLQTPTAGATPGSATASGTFSATDVSSSTTLDAVLAAMRSGGAYINVHTSKNKSGELRGQIQAGP